MIILFALLKAGVGDGVAGKEILVVAFCAAPCEAILAYDGLEVIAEFFMAIICSSINVSRCADASAAFRTSSRILWLLGPCLVFFLNADKAWRKLLKLLARGLCLSWISLRVLSIYNPNIWPYSRVFFGIGAASASHSGLLPMNAKYWAISYSR